MNFNQREIQNIAHDIFIYSKYSIGAAAAHGLGTAAFATKQDAFPSAAISMASTASTCMVLVSVNIALGA